MGGERAVLFATDPPYAVGYTGGSHPQSWANRGAANRDKDWSGQYVEAKNADVKNTEEAGVELYRGFIGMAIKHALVAQRRLVLLARSRRQMMLESIWNEFGAFVHQQIIWVKSRPVLTYSTYLWQHEPCLFGWIKGEKPKTLRAQVGADGGRVSDHGLGRSRVPKSRPTRIRPRSPANSSPSLWRCTPSAVTFVMSPSRAADRNWLRRSRPDGAATRSRSQRHLSRLHWNAWPPLASSRS